MLRRVVASGYRGGFGVGGFRAVALAMKRLNRIGTLRRFSLEGLGRFRV